MPLRAPRQIVSGTSVDQIDLFPHSTDLKGNGINLSGWPPLLVHLSSASKDAITMDNQRQHTLAEEKAFESIRKKHNSLRAFLHNNRLSEPIIPTLWLSCLIGIKNALGNINNEVGFIATV